MKRLLVILAISVITTSAAAQELRFSEPTVPEEWKEKNAIQLHDLAAQLVTQGESAKDQRALLASYVGYRFLNDAVATHSIPLTVWSGFSSALAADMDEAVVINWRKGLREGWIADQEALTGMSEDDFLSLVSTLRHLKDSELPLLWAKRVETKYLLDAATIRAVGVTKWKEYVLESRPGLTDEGAAQWHAKITEALIPDPESMAAMKDDDFTGVIGMLRALAETDAKSLVITRHTAIDLVDVTKTRAVGLSELRRRVVTYHHNMDEEMKELWLVRLKEVYVSDDASLASLSSAEFAGLISALRAVGEEKLDAIYVQYVTKSENWRTGGNLLATSRALKRAGEAGLAARLRVGDHLAGVLAGEEAQAVIDLKEAELISRELVDAMPPELKTRWINGLRKHYAQEEDLKNLSKDNYLHLVRLLDRFNDLQLPALCASWVQAGDHWQSLDLTKLKELSLRLNTLGKEGEEVRTSMVLHLIAKLRGNPEAARAGGCQAWAALGRGFSGNVVPKDKAIELAAALRTVFTDDAGILARLTAAEFRHLVTTLKYLGDTKTEELNLQWLKASEAWKAGDLSWFLQALPKSGEEAAKARVNLIKQIEERHMGDAASIRAVSVRTWTDIIREVHEFMGTAAKSRWAQSLQTALMPDGGVGDLELSEFIALSRALCLLDNEAAAVPATEWLANNVEDAAAISTADLSGLVMAAAKSNRERVLLLMDQVDAAWRTKLAASEAAPEDCRNLSRAWLALGARQKSREWASLMYNQLLGSEDVRAVASYSTLDLLVSTMHTTGMLDRHKQEYPAFAHVAASLAASGKLEDAAAFPKCKHFGMLLSMPASSETLRQALVDPEGQPRQVVVRILSYAYERAGVAAEWRKFLDQQIAASDGDVSIHWMLARAYAEMARLGDIKPWRGKTEWLDPAFAAAESAEARLAVTTEYIERYRIVARPAVAISFIHSIQDQFSGNELLRLKDLENSLQLEQAKLEELQERSRAMQEAARTAGRLAYYRGRLEAYEAEGDELEASKLRSAIAVLQQKLREE